MQCANCKARLAKTARFCSRCGESVSVGAEIAVAQQVETVETGGGVAGTLQGSYGQVGGKRQYGDNVSRDKIEGDIVGRDKNIYNIVNPPPTDPPASNDKTAVIDSNYSLQIQGICSAAGLVSVELEHIYVTLSATVRGDKSGNIPGAISLQLPVATAKNWG